MYSNVAIEIENLSKCYQIYDQPRDRLYQMLMRGRKTFYREFWALQNINFEIYKGETVGIIGQNGCGKSTLLQLICGTLSPTTGSINTKGRIAALLELGSGFNPEFTGRENIYMNASVLGLTSDEIDDRFHSIAEFANIGDFIEQPVKTYSSGMMVRLAFAVAINVDPEILVVDEALAVGDELFQRKCFSRIEAIRSAGATILFVSHSGGIIVELCDRAILLDSGEKIAVGKPKNIVGKYQKLIYAPQEKREEIRKAIIKEDSESESCCENSKKIIEDGMKKIVNEGSRFSESYDENLKPSSTITYESNGAIIQSPSLLTLDGKEVNNIVRGEMYKYTYEVVFEKQAQKVRFGMLIKTMSGVELGGGVSATSSRDAIESIGAKEKYNVEFHFRCSLNPGVYFLNAGVVGEVDENEIYLHRLLDIAMFRVLPIQENYSTGIVNFECRSTALMIE